MYQMNRQMRIENFAFPYGQLDKNNEWVKLADLGPWEEAERPMPSSLSTMGIRHILLGRTHHQTEIEVQRRVDGAACQ